MLMSGDVPGVCMLRSVAGVCTLWVLLVFVRDCVGFTLFLESVWLVCRAQGCGAFLCVWGGSRDYDVGRYGMGYIDYFLCWAVARC